MTTHAGRTTAVRGPLVRFALMLALASRACVAPAQQADDGMIVIPGHGESAETAIANAQARVAAAKPAANVSAALEAAALNRRQVTPAAAQDDAGQPAGAEAAPPGWIRVAPPAEPPATARYAQQGAAAAPRAVPIRPVALRTARLPVASVPVAPAAATGTPQPAVPAGQQDGEAIRRAAVAFLQQQAAGLPGKTTITVAPAFQRGLAACTTLEPFLPTGARLWGRTTVGVRCAGERPWTIYLQAKLAVQATYYVAARQIAPGEALTAADLVARDGDLTVLPLAVITDPSQAVGAIALSRVAAGLPLRQDMLKSAASVSIGQTVRVVAAGQGFTISAEGSVLSNGSPGQQVRVRMAAGQIVTAIVKDAGTVEIPL
ncbi:flagellar basal body P-ring formation chaperone FlgA [Burkholderia alba]|uniref:flagellar basal body P-ring formation chaperone FlgA n=1 Tax=Burkholderia alba TaxID=2683677 RepID=UPI002B059AE4|nr:flagellar basal body P-ring formation chaperone FlgA [Burkholderia alba]